MRGVDSQGREVEIEPTGREPDWVAFCAAAPTHTRKRRRMWISWLLLVAGRLRLKPATGERRDREQQSPEEFCARIFGVHVNSIWQGVASELAELERDPRDLELICWDVDLLCVHPELDVVREDDDGSINVA